MPLMAAFASFLSCRHALANVPEGLKGVTYNSDKSSWMSRFLSQCPTNLDPHAKADVLKADTVLASLHEQATSDPSNRTSRGQLGDKIETHFAALVHVDGGLYELDGRKGGPIRHGNTNELSLLKDACTVVQSFIDRADPGDVRFSILALAPRQS
jgi:ubiquitin carboxyl-terminal hydrolase L3